jgi:hypothetical protein
MSEKHYPTAEAGQLDAGATVPRVDRCALLPWCVLQRGHEDACLALPQGESKRPEWDARVNDPIGWNKSRRYR